jgi:F0F1-type ATP synthase assembly protein I
MLFLVKGKQSGWSALAGGLAYWLPTVIFARVVATCASARALTRFIITFLGSEAVKLGLSGVLFLLAIIFLHAQVIYAVTGLVAAIAAFWIASVACLWQKEAVL